MKTEKTVKLTDYIENPDNPYVATPDALERLRGKLERVPKGLKAMRLAYVRDFRAIDGTDYRGQRVIISGNKRLRELKVIYGDEGEVPAEWFCDVTDMTAEERREFIVSANTVDGTPDAEKLLEQYDREELDRLMGSEAVEALLAATEEDTAEIDEGDKGDLSDGVTLVNFGGLRIPVSEEEISLIRSAYEKYVQNGSCCYGYFSHLIVQEATAHD